jgi:hypothetical protein
MTDMNINTLESLGISIETIHDRIVDQAVETLLSSSGFDPDSDQEVRYESRFKKEITARIQKAVDEKIAALAAVHLIPRVGEMIESADMRRTNTYGEPKSPPMTFKEYLASRAEVYMSEDVDYTGKSKEEGGYNWRSCGPRLAVLMKSYIKDSMDAAAKSAVNDINKVIANNIEKVAKDAIASAASAIKVAVSV